MPLYTVGDYTKKMKPEPLRLRFHFHELIFKKQVQNNSTFCFPKKQTVFSKTYSIVIV